MPNESPELSRLEDELAKVEREYDRIEQMGSQSDAEHRLARQIEYLSNQINRLKAGNETTTAEQA
jgi:hypothetical protein